MIQGTASSVGKSIITAGLCRILYENGHKVAPFKSQNMSLNSYITHEGKEMGRAQVAQAEAAGIKPKAAMNPILLKPTGDRRCQVILNGEVYADMTAMEYHKFKPELKLKVKEIYEELQNEFDTIVMEGAGSPAEINLREGDLVNMGMAELVDAPVILVGDIDRGGVFASIVGTLQLLSEEERKRVKGVIINKFRGDVEILKPGLKMLEDIINIPVLGVVPYTKLNIDDEDGVSVESKIKRKIEQDELVIKIVRLPYMSNFTDFNVLFSLSKVNVSYAIDSEELKEADLIIIPGSKNTIKDLMYLNNNGFWDEILKAKEEDKTIFGICGGFQMLGKKIINEEKVENEINDIEGLGLLDIETEFKSSKVTTQVSGVISDDSIHRLFNCKDKYIEGYEIHMGRTTFVGKDIIPFIEINEVLGNKENKVEGYRNKEGNVFGTYIHGIFDSLEFTNSFLNNLKNKKGLELKEDNTVEFNNYNEMKEKEYIKLSNILRDSLDLDKIYKIIDGQEVERNYY
ncbi:cobyric acid synthase [Clostridium tarantellae]|uniref:Cobyric acid synthase n=1 Tax=Clostridium tarantellae TaxID=39493 RepID=A0A6I1MPU3_9CLOT|nr:cobyric acid synthase [Clostridium tarantellae]MPQ44157.1 cobyric acid synthase [Clostridium tarantellae]